MIKEAFSNGRVKHSVRRAVGQTGRLPQYGLGELRAHYVHIKKREREREAVLEPLPPKKKLVSVRNMRR